MSVRFKLFLLWFFSYALCFVSILVFALFGFSLMKQSPQYLTQITGIYAPYLTPIVAFWFAEDIIGRSRSHNSQSSTVAFTTSAFFNLVMIVILCSVFFAKRSEGIIEETISTMNSTSTLLAFIVGPAIGYFFSKVEENTKVTLSNEETTPTSGDTGIAARQ